MLMVFDDGANNVRIATDGVVHSDDELLRRDHVFLREAQEFFLECFRLAYDCNNGEIKL